MKIYKHCIDEPFSFLVNDTTLSLDNSVKRIRYGKLQYNINREATKISVLPYSEIGKYEYLTGEELLPHNNVK